ncbi:MAG: thiamine biosynthesis protein ThiI [Methanosaeta sp. PtaB.Bin018]|jgi:thiamine biosynthesis protein ThiI|nr:tRNA 4-thiouridine(8) synthase ThiI [Methanothrix sp.]OPX74504.1 MAG: thiamine biosynthesis protein ThiI [Methanosaeta sp. PtaB.Bin018]OPY46494.1 MAG: thiamine biosynthesis protein ThiI [Methanosaeta sp. PtaU1.Bin016]
MISGTEGQNTIQDVVLVRYGEITLKDGWTRRNWERILAGNISFNLQKSGVKFRIVRDEGRIFVHTSDPRASEIASQTFGVVSVSPAQAVIPDLGAIAHAAVQIAQRARPLSFAIRPRRFKVPFSSEEIGRVVGDAVRSSSGSVVDLERPELEIFVEARKERAYIFTKTVKGLGGLPLGSQGKMLALISGGIDSPVAAWMMMRRGCPISLLHFDSRPYADATEQSMASAKVLARWTSGRKINFIQVPISRGIEKIAAHCPRATCVLCRRLMYRIAAEVMLDQGALGIVTGYSMGQVASQTAENILAEQAAIGMPIFHPLIAMDKSEIMDLARKIGTLDVTETTKPCSAVPKRPMTKARVDEILTLEEDLGLRELARALVQEMNVTKIG